MLFRATCLVILIAIPQQRTHLPNREKHRQMFDISLNSNLVKITDKEGSTRLLNVWYLETVNDVDFANFAATKHFKCWNSELK